jgi:nucleotide-binding universal stress UspA family protein
MGTTTSRVVRESKVPVLTFNSNVLLKPFKKILLPLDLTVETKQKVTNAIDLALRFKASIAVVSVLYSTKIEDIRLELQQQLEQVKNFIKEDGIECTAKLIETEGGTKALAQSILRYSNEVNADLIMIMTQQETKLVEFFMGSSAQTLIRLSTVPVMSITPKELWL